MQFLVGNQLASSALHPRLGIKQGDTLSPTLFSLLTAILVYKLKAHLPGARCYL